MANPLFRKTNSILSAAPVSAAPLSLPAGVLSPTIPLAEVIFPDLDLSQYPVTPGEALQVPAVKRALSLYTTLSSRFKLSASDGSAAWLNNTPSAITPQVRIAFTITDLIFYNRSLWAVLRDDNGSISHAEHIERGRWSTDAQGLVQIDLKPFPQQDLIYFQGLLPGAGFLEDGRDSVRQYLAISRTVSNRVQMPSPVTLVKETQESGSDPDEVTEAMDSLGNSLQSRRGGLVYVPFGVEIEGFGAGDSANELFLQARNACRLDVANHLSISASLLEGAADGSSDSYTNTLMVQNELLELSIKGFTEAIVNRLSQDDVTPEGVTVSFDYSTFDTTPNDKSDLGTIPTPTNEETE